MTLQEVARAMARAQGAELDLETVRRVCTCTECLHQLADAQILDIVHRARDWQQFNALLKEALSHHKCAVNAAA